MHRNTSLNNLNIMQLSKFYMKTKTYKISEKPYRFCKQWFLATRNKNIFLDANKFMKVLDLKKPITPSNAVPMIVIIFMEK